MTGCFVHRRRVAICVVALATIVGTTSTHAFLPDDYSVNAPALLAQLILNLKFGATPNPVSLAGTISHKTITVNALLGQPGAEDGFVTEFFKIPQRSISLRARQAAEEIGSADAWVDYRNYLHIGDTGPQFHFDSETFGYSQQHIKGLHENAVTFIQEGYVHEARTAIGSALHTLQDFYSHSNWVELGYTEPLPMLAWPFDQLDSSVFTQDRFSPNPPHSCNQVQPDPDDPFHVTTGYYEDWHLYRPFGCIHGGPTDYDGVLNFGRGINKDTTDKTLSPHAQLHLKAAELARLATVAFLRGFHTRLTELVAADEADRLLGDLLSVRETITVTNNNLSSPVQIGIDLGNGRLKADSDLLWPGGVQEWSVPEMAVCVPCSIGNGGTVYKLVLTGEWSLSITGLIGYTLHLPPFLEFIDVTSDRGTTTLLAGRHEHTDLFVGFMAPHLVNTYRIRDTR